MDEENEKAKAHGELMGKIAAWSGWALAFLSLFLGTYLLNKIHLELVELQRENKELKVNLTHDQFNQRLRR